MLMILGMLVFKRQTLPYTKLLHTAAFRWPANSRVGARPAPQYLGPDTETLTLSVTLIPEVTGGRSSLFMLQAMATSGCAWPLISGDGVIYGMYAITKIVNTQTELQEDGRPKKIEFTLDMQRIDENMVSMFGDLAAQAKAMPGKAADALSMLGG